MTFTVSERGRLDRFLSDRFAEHSRSKLAKLVTHGLVQVDGEVVTKTGFDLRPGMVVGLEEVPETPAHDLTPYAVLLDVPYEDEHLLVVSKPRGMATHPAPSTSSPSLVNALLARSHGLSSVAGEFRPGIVHRLDKDTTGLLLVAKTDAVHVALAKQIQAKTALRRYVAIVAGEPASERFVVDAPIGRDRSHPTRMAVVPEGKGARTLVHVLNRLEAGTLLAVTLQTGRTHQIRVHLAACNLPVLGDPLYSPKSLREHPLQLHAALLSFDHPVSKVRTTVFDPPPHDFYGHELVDRARLEAVE
ncbi:MAG: RluA family pseudouridine synthase [Fimbriimonadaceae bacterium]|nr:RluA family pseudouridine synthase [Fimbriimonadaceae bacterium]QYK55139.1 MAG: RluA family pseudouridine synthase [Fimbriimonadaceae bacterium]